MIWILAFFFRIPNTAWKIPGIMTGYFALGNRKLKPKLLAKVFRIETPKDLR
jgi:hypothetical protein